MIKRTFVALLAMSMFSLAQGSDLWEDANKESIDATQPLTMELEPTGGPVPHDLALDPLFANGGLKSMWPLMAGWTGIEDSVRTFPWVSQATWPGIPIPVPVHSGYYVVGKQKNVAGNRWRVVITRVRLNGDLDTSFGTNGWIVTLELADIVDAQIVGNRAYVLANTIAGAVPPLTRVACIDLSTPTGVNCFPFLAGIQTWGITNATVRTAAYGQRLLHDSRYGLFVAARIMNSNRGEEVGIARISAVDGSLVTGFRDNGYNIGLPSWSHQTQAEVAVNALAITPAGTLGGTRLYVAGQMKLTTADHDGFILGLSPVTGATGANWSWNAHSYYYENDNTGGWKKDAITALTVLRNGKVAFAGWSESDDVNAQPMLMGRIHANGSYDASFCAGNAHYGSRGCLTDPPWIAGALPFLTSYKPHSLPVAIAERAQTRDLVVAQRFQDNGYRAFFPDDGRVRTLMQQFSASGNTLRATRTLDYPNNGAGLKWSRPFDMYLGPAGPKAEVLAVAGTRQWNSTDFDMTISHLIATDSIFANQFGRSNSD